MSSALVPFDPLVAFFLLCGSFCPPFTHLKLTHLRYCSTFDYHLSPKTTNSPNVELPVPGFPAGALAELIPSLRGLLGLAEAREDLQLPIAGLRGAARVKGSQLPLASCMASKVQRKTRVSKYAGGGGGEKRAKDHRASSVLSYACAGVRIGGPLVSSLN